MQIRLGHSPDPDDAFMFYGLAAGKVDTGPYDVHHVMADIQTLNERALAGELEMTALSVHAYAHTCHTYVLTRCGGSFGMNYGPTIVAREPFGPAALADKVVGVPGELTTAFLLLKLIVPEVKYEVLPFDEIIGATQAGSVDCGLIIHEGQLTYRQAGLHCIMDLGAWWQESTALPLPLGVNAVRRDLEGQVRRSLRDMFLASIRYGLEHRDEAVAYALDFARDMGVDLADRFIGMYVNDLTLDAGDQGMRAIEVLLQRAAEAGIIQTPPKLDFV